MASNLHYVILIMQDCTQKCEMNWKSLTLWLPIFIIVDYRYYNLDAYFKNKMEKELKRGIKKVMDSERTVFNDEEQRRCVLVV